MNIFINALFKIYLKLILKNVLLDSVPSNSSTETSLVSRFIWPSFYLNINSSNCLNEKESSRKVKKNGSARLQNSSSSTHLSGDAKDDTRQMSDQQWALFFILILVVIAFLIAFLANSLYASYFEISYGEL